MPAGTHPQDAAAYLGSDVYRLSTTATGTGWAAYLKNALATAKFGESVSVPVYIEKGTGNGTVTLNAVSESDPSKTATAVARTPVDGGVGGAVPATLALTMGTPASFGAFTPGLGKDYFATTAANVISTAGDATLSVADPGHGHRPPGQRRVLAAVGPAGVSGSTSGTYAPVGGSSAPTTLKTWNGPVSNDPVAVSFKQTVGDKDALRTGSYAKTLTSRSAPRTPSLRGASARAQPVDPSPRPSH